MSSTEIGIWTSGIINGDTCVGGTECDAPILSTSYVNINDVNG